MYGVEIWGWTRREKVEKVQSRFLKTSMGLPRNTPSNIWKMESGRRDVETKAMSRAERFIMKLTVVDER